MVPNALKEEAVVVELPKAMIEDKKIQEEVHDKVVEEKITEELEWNLFSQESTEEKLEIKEEKVEYKSVKDRLLNPDFKGLQLYVVGQILGTYIVCQNEQGLYLIDQHAAKERVNYELVENKFKNKEVLSVGTLIPITIELNASDYLKIKEQLLLLEELGFIIEEFGINTYTIKAHPSWIKEGYEEEIVRAIFDEIILLGDHFDRIRFNNKMIATIACKMSVRANTRLSREAMEEIIRELKECKNPYNCAHGRPTIVKFSTYDLERMFKRVMN